MNEERKLSQTDHLELQLWASRHGEVQARLNALHASIQLGRSEAEKIDAQRRAFEDRLKALYEIGPAERVDLATGLIIAASAPIP